VIRMQFVGRPCFSLLYSTKVRVSEKIPCKKWPRVKVSKIIWWNISFWIRGKWWKWRWRKFGNWWNEFIGSCETEPELYEIQHFFLSEWGYFEGPKSSNIALQDGYMNLMRLPEQVLMSSSFRFWSLVELSCTWRNSRKPPRNPLCSSQFHNSPLLNMEHFISVFHTRLIHYRVESDLQYRSGTVIYLINAHNHSDLILFLSILAFLFF